jgi:glutamate dehydrogenase
VLLAYVKIVLEREILDSEVPDEPWTADVLRNYFPTPLRERYADRMAEHPLRREIVTTVLVNEAVNRGGTSFFYRATDETGASWTDVLRAYIVVRDIYGLRELWAATEALDNKVPTAAQTLGLPGGPAAARPLGALAGVQPALADRRARRDRTAAPRPRGAAAAARLAHPGKRARLAAPARRRDDRRRAAGRTGRVGHPADVRVRACSTSWRWPTTPGSRSTTWPRSTSSFSERFRVDDLLSRISALPRGDRWQTLARMALRYDLYAALAALTSEVVTGTSGSGDAEARVLEWERSNAASITRARKRHRGAGGLQ